MSQQKVNVKKLLMQQVEAFQVSNIPHNIGECFHLTVTMSLPPHEFIQISWDLMSVTAFHPCTSLLPSKIQCSMYVGGLWDLQMLWSGSLLNVNLHLAVMKLDYMLPTGQSV